MCRDSLVVHTIRGCLDGWDRIGRHVIHVAASTVLRYPPPNLLIMTIDTTSPHQFYANCPLPIPHHAPHPRRPLRVPSLDVRRRHCRSEFFLYRAFLCHLISTSLDDLNKPTHVLTLTHRQRRACSPSRRIACVKWTASSSRTSCMRREDPMYRERVRKRVVA